LRSIAPPFVRSWHTIVSIADGEEHRLPAQSIRHTRGARGRDPIRRTVRPDLAAVMHPSLVPFLDRAERDVGEQW